MLEGVSGFPWALACPKYIRALPYMITYLLDSILSDLTFQNRGDSLNPTVLCGIPLWGEISCWILIFYVLSSCYESTCSSCDLYPRKYRNKAPRAHSNCSGGFEFGWSIWCLRYKPLHGSPQKLFDRTFSWFARDWKMSPQNFLSLSWNTFFPCHCRFMEDAGKL
jgi:hypothetical protein